MSRITVVEMKGVPSHRRDCVEAAILEAGSFLVEDHEAWVVPARRPPAYNVRITGPRGFYREVRFGGPESEAEIAAIIRQAMAS